MRQLIVRVPRGCGEEVLAVARAHQGTNLASFRAASEDNPVDLLLVHVSNAKVETLIDELQQLPDLHVSLFPDGVITLRPPASEAPEQVVDVTTRSPIEIFLGGLQSVGSGKVFSAMPWQQALLSGSLSSRTRSTSSPQPC